MQNRLVSTTNINSSELKWGRVKSFRKHSLTEVTITLLFSGSVIVRISTVTHSE